MDEEDEIIQHVNPCPPAGLSAQERAVLRGDSIEGTAYNQRWLLSTLMTTLKALHDLLPSLQNENNLTTYEFTPQKQLSPVERNSPNASVTPYHISQAAESASPFVDDSALSPRTPFSESHIHDSFCTPQRPSANLSATETTPKQNLTITPGQAMSTSNSDPFPAVEVPKDVEEGACQLWDMCGDKKLALHLLNLQDHLVLHMLGYSLKDPTALRLTEILCGSVFNICCCLPEGCVAVLRDPALLMLLVSLPERCTDSPTLIQAFRLLYRIVCFLNENNKTSEQLRMSSQLHSVAATPCDTESQVDDIFSRVTETSPNNNKPQEVDNSKPATGGISTVDTSSAIQLEPDDSNVASLPFDSLVSSQNATPITNLNSDEWLSLSESLGLVLHQNSLEQFLSFILQHSCQEELVIRSVQLLQALLCFRDPHSGQDMAHHYTLPGLVTGLVKLLDEWHKSATAYDPGNTFDHDSDDDSSTFSAGQRRLSKKSYDEDLDTGSTVTAAAHCAVACLFTFIDTKAADTIVSTEQHTLEPPLVRYITAMEEQLVLEIRRHKRHSAAQEDHSSGALEYMADHLRCAIQLLTLLVRSVLQPEVIMGLANVISLLDLSAIFWEEERQNDVKDAAGTDGPTSSSDSLQIQANNSDEQTQRDQDADCSKTLDCISEQTDESFGDDSYPNDNSGNKSKNILDSLDHMSNVAIGLELNKTRAKHSSRRKKQSLEYKRFLKNRDRKRTRRKSTLLENSFNDVTEVRDSEEIVCLSAAALDELRHLRRCLEAYFANIMQYWFSFGDLRDDKSPLCRILSALEQCHVHEVLPVLEAVKKWDPALVSNMQEKLLDHKAFPRMVALLAKLYE